MVKLLALIAVLFSFSSLAHEAENHPEHMIHECSFEKFQTKLDKFLSDVSLYLDNREDKTQILAKIFQESTLHYIEIDDTYCETPRLSVNYDIENPNNWYSKTADKYGFRYMYHDKFIFAEIFTIYLNIKGKHFIDGNSE